MVLLRLNIYIAAVKAYHNVVVFVSKRRSIPSSRFSRPVNSWPQRTAMSPKHGQTARSKHRILSSATRRLTTLLSRLSYSLSCTESSLHAIVFSQTRQAAVCSHAWQQSTHKCFSWGEENHHGFLISYTKPRSAESYCEDIVRSMHRLEWHCFY